MFKCMVLCSDLDEKAPDRWRKGPWEHLEWLDHAWGVVKSVKVYFSSSNIFLGSLSC